MCNLVLVSDVAYFMVLFMVYYFGLEKKKEKIRLMVEKSCHNFVHTIFFSLSGYVCK